MNKSGFFILFSLILSVVIISLPDSFAQNVIPPRHQWKQTNDIDQLTCKEGLVLMQKHNGAPACVSPSAYLKLIDRGYGMFDSSLMMKRSLMMNSLMSNMATNNHLMEHWHEMMLNDPIMMNQTMTDWVSQMKSNPEILANVMGPMTSDPSLREQMIEQMKTHTHMENSLKDNPRWMDSVHRPMMERDMGPGMDMEKGMHYGGCKWCPEYENHVDHKHTMGFTNSDRMMDLMHHMWINPDMTQDMHNFMLQNPAHMGHMEYQMMGPMLGFMMDDPELREKMIELMIEHQEFMNSIRHDN